MLSTIKMLIITDPPFYVYFMVFLWLFYVFYLSTLVYRYLLVDGEAVEGCILGDPCCSELIWILGEGKGTELAQAIDVSRA